MATLAKALADHGVELRMGHQGGSSIARAIDRWIYVFTAVSFIVITLTGFIPDALHKIALVRAGQRPPFPLALHLHAAFMGCFLLLLATQATLMATGRRDLHQRLGRVAMVLVPAIVVIGIILVPTIYHQYWSVMQAAPPAMRPKLRQEIFIHRLDLILLAQLRIGFLFPVFIFIAWRARMTNAGLHKRMMFLATAMPLMAAVDRITWLPTSLPASPLSIDLYTLAVVSPMLIWDLIRNRTVHEAYLIWLAVNLPFAAALHVLWRSVWWHSVAPWLMGV